MTEASRGDSRVTAALVAFVVLTPFASSLTLLDAAHPDFALLLPRPALIATALLFAASLLWIAVLEIAARRPLAPVFAIGVLNGFCALGASVVGFDPVPGIAAGIAFLAIALASNAMQRVAGAGAAPLLLRAILWTGIFLCGVALLVLLLRRPVALYAFAHGRALGTFANPNELAEYALFIAAVGCGAWLEGGRLRRLGAAALVVATITLAWTGSRSGEVAYGIGALSLLAMLRPRRGLVALTAIVALAGLVLAFGLDRRHNPADSDARLAAWRTGIRTVVQFPLTGVGIGAYHRVYPAMRAPSDPGPETPIGYDPHNFYLSYAAETGLAGLVTIVWALIRFAKLERRAVALASPAARRLSLALVAGLIATGAHLFFNAFAMTIALWGPLTALALGVTRSGNDRAS